jgi:cation diffusion facilitator family transporter
MLRVSRWIAGRVVPNYAETENVAARSAVGRLEGWTSIVVNTVLFGVKGSLGLVTGSVALLADAVHTLADSFTSGIVIFGFRMARKPADRAHPFGHGRSESIAGLAIGILLGVVALEALRAAVERILHPKHIHAPLWIVLVILGTIVVKELLAQFSMDLGRLIQSQPLLADGWHHRTDVFATALVVISFVGAELDLDWFDGAMGVGVSLIIGWAAYSVVREAVGPLLGEPAPDRMYREIDRLARSVDGVEGVHDVLVHRYGGTNLVSLHIEVSDQEPPLRLHEMSETIEETIARRFPGHAIVHVDPVNRSAEHYAAVQEIVAGVMAHEEGVASFHDLRIVGAGPRAKVVFDVAPRPGARPLDAAALLAKVRRAVQRRFPAMRVTMTVEPPYLRSLTEPPREKTP